MYWCFEASLVRLLDTNHELEKAAKEMATSAEVTQPPICCSYASQDVAQPPICCIPPSPGATDRGSRDISGAITRRRPIRLPRNARSRACAKSRPRCRSRKTSRNPRFAASARCEMQQIGGRALSNDSKGPGPIDPLRALPAAAPGCKMSAAGRRATSPLSAPHEPFCVRAVVFAANQLALLARNLGPPHSEVVMPPAA